MEKFRLFLVELLSFDTTKILFGRYNFEYIDFNDNIIVIDSFTSQMLATQDSFNNVDTRYINSFIRHTATIDFFGKDAESTANKYIALSRSQLATDLIYKYKVKPYYFTNYQDLKMLSGTDYNNRIQITLFVDENIQVDIPEYPLTANTINYIIKV